MQCIWTGDLRNLWHASQLSSIIDQLGDWFLYIYRPWICACLEQWKSHEAQKKLENSRKLSFKSNRPIERVSEDYWNRSLPQDNPEEGSAGEKDYDDKVGSSGIEHDDKQSKGNELSETDTKQSDDKKYERRNQILGSRERSLCHTPSPTRDDSDDSPISTRTRSCTRARSADPSICSSPPTPSRKGQQYLSPDCATASSVRPVAHSSKTSPATLELPLRLGRARSCSTNA